MKKKTNPSGLCLLENEESRPPFLFVPQEPKLQRQADITRQSQDPTFAMSIEVLIALGSYWQTLRGGWGPCVRVHGLLAEIRAALCTPRE